jgi:3-deoxy-D-manno-octulosonic-acid transferase
MNYAPGKVKILIAPHQINAEKIDQFIAKIGLKSAKFSQHDIADLAEKDVFIIDTIGLLGRAYSYADVAYVGGAAGTTGMHNILEPATFGIPILTGSNIDKFPEAQQLRRLAGLYTVSTDKETSQMLKKLFENANFRKKTGMICGHFVQGQTGATAMIINYLKYKDARNS